jgi:metallo-beta-lactamase family protein
MLLDGKKVVPIHGQRVPVNATIKTMGGLSGHADQTDLMNWFGTLARSKPRVVLTHGEDKARAALGRPIKARHNIKVESPALNAVIDF